jgi:3',5'-cyclic AMP phosphodiesterase CpdA
MFTLAHFSDLHLGPLPSPRPTELLSKRFLGYLSWVRRRRKIHKLHVLQELKSDINTLKPDHVAITGDLINISLPGEFEHAAAWLKELGEPDWVSVVPGNHDAYVDVPWNTAQGRWASYFTGDSGSGLTDHPFPFVRRRAEIALVGLSSACPTPWGFASGTLGAKQIDRLGRELEKLGRDGLFRVVLLHHPPQPGGASWRKRLTDAPEFREVIASAGAELVLHGHNHTFAEDEIPAAGRPIPVLGVPSASAVRAGHKPQSHYAVYEIEPGPTGWAVTAKQRAFEPEQALFNWGPSRRLEISRPQIDHD